MQVRKVEVRETAKGKGVFALYNIQKGQTVMAYGGVRVSMAEMQAAQKDGEHAWWNDYAKQVSDTHLLVPRRPDDFGGHLLNHSCDPCSAFQKDVIVATRTIAKGEEVTICYRWLWQKEDHECLCDARVCAGIMGVGILPLDPGVPDGRIRVRAATVGAVMAAAALNERQDVCDEYARGILELYADAGATEEWIQRCTTWAVDLVMARGGAERKVMNVLRGIDATTMTPPPPDLMF
jgi:hypothetical protein